MRWGVVAISLVVTACGQVAVDGSATTSMAAEFGPTLAEDVADRVMADAKERLPQSETEEPQILSVEPKTYQDSSLDCPEDGETYEEVSIRGFQLILEAAGGQLDYRVDDSGEFRLCVSQSSGLESETVTEHERQIESDQAEKNPDEEEATDAMGLPAQLADQIMEDAAAFSGVARSDVSLVSATEETFNDASLGCPKKDESYIQVITPGWIVMVEAGSTTLEYHASEAGAFVRCS